MSEITQDRLDRIVETADEILSALAGKNEDVHPDDSKKMCQLWDELNDSLAPPEVVKAIVLELSELRKEREAAVPVYQMRLIDGTEDQTIWVEVSNEEFNTPLKNPDEWERRILYTTPPAQPVAVPDEMTMQKALSAINQLSWQECTRDAYMLGWNACRAAMLAAPVVSGWIPCSERMPEVGDIVLTADNGCVNVGEMEHSGANYHYFTSVVSGRELPATHWMPLPAAPGKEG